jgi:hypothetical protein
LERELAVFTNPKPAAKQPQPQPTKQQQQPQIINSKTPSNDMAARQMISMHVLPPVLSPSKQNRYSKEISILTERQRLFKEAALEAKRDGNTKVALVYMKHAKVKFHLNILFLGKG